MNDCKLQKVWGAYLLIFSGVLLMMFCAHAQADGPMEAEILTIPLGIEGTSYASLSPGVRGGTLTVSSISDVKKFNHWTAHETSTTMVTSQMFRGMVDLHPLTGEVIPELAMSWDISEDGLEIIFHLREGIRWSNGHLFTADDVVFTFNDIIYNEDIEYNGRESYRLPDETFPAVEKVDDYAVKVTLSMVFRPILQMMGAAIAPKHVLAQHIHKCNPDVEPGTFNGVWGLGTDPSEIVGLGPFLLEEHIADQQIVMRRNPYYYHYDQNGIQLPYVDKYVILIVASQDVSFLKFRNGELDVLSLRPEDVPILKRMEERKKMTVFVGNGRYGTLWIMFNQDVPQTSSRTLFRDVRYRKAIAHAIDKETLIDNLYNGLAIPQWSPVSMMSPFYAGRDTFGGPITERDAVVYPYDLEKARALLVECGLSDDDGDGYLQFEDGATVEFELTTNAGNTLREAFCLILKDDLEKIGLKVNYHPVDFNSLVTELFAGTLEACVLGLTGGDEPHGGANVYKSTGGLHCWHYSATEDPYEIEKRIDELFALGISTWDANEAFEHYKEYQRLYATEDLGLIFTVNQRDCWGYYNRIGNANSIQFGYGLTTDLVYRH